MAKLFINKDIVADDDKMKHWYLTGADGMSFSDVQQFISWVDPDDNHIDIEFHSCGGDVDEGYAIYDAIRATGKEISATVVGRCGSMATIILLAAPLERRKMYQHAKICIHDPYCPGIDGALDIDTLDEIKSGLETERNRMLSLYVERCGVDRDALDVQMKKANWFGGATAKQLGFVSEVIMPKSAKVVINNKRSMAKKEDEVTVSKSLLGRLLAKLGYAKIEDVPAVALELTTAGGDVLTIEREEGEPQVGDSASPDGEHVMPDGKTIVVKDGVITEIKDEEDASADEDVEALKARIEELETENASLKTNARTVEDNKILNAIKMAGGVDWLAKNCSTYKVAGRAQAVRALGKRDDEDGEEETEIQRKLREEKEKRGMK